MFIDLSDPLFQSAIPILQHIESHGYEAYFVGGCVRDTVLDLQIHDIDIASSALPEEIETIFSYTIDVGKKHGTIIVVEKGQAYEITTFRTEGKYTDYRRPDEVKFVRNLAEDTLRRDFTINALAIDRTGKLYDYHGGLLDMDDGLIRCVGNPMERFEEDALRMMRALRFASQLGFEIETETLQAIRNLKHNLKYIAIERIRIEFNKFLSGKFFINNAFLLAESGLADYLPGLSSELANEVMQNVIEDIQPLFDRDEYVDIRIIWARMLIHMGLHKAKAIRSYLKQWTHSNQFVSDVIDLIELFYLVKFQNVNHWIVYSYPYDLILMVQDYYDKHEDLKEAFLDKLYHEISIESKKDIVINGQELIERLNLKTGGPIVGKLLNMIEYLIVEGELSNEEGAIEEFIKNYYYY